ncbi:hypothetical protein AB0K14_23725 [Actinosynnema sp. NPDC050801]|uniref:hypothetical protein n=1 Tax=unclassified Actinosynnema TaxID=2637065 RepID=UPI0033FEB794
MNSPSTHQSIGTVLTGHPADRGATTIPALVSNPTGEVVVTAAIDGALRLWHTNARDPYPRG